MKAILITTCVVSTFLSALAGDSDQNPFLSADPLANPLIDYPKFEQIVFSSRMERESHRLTEDEFLAGLKEPGVVLLDARSANMFTLRHITGAISLPFTDFTAASLAAVLPRHETKILIYCNNNFLGAKVSFASKMAPASLNLSTYISLKAYGYTNIFELGPLLQIATTKIPFSGAEVSNASDSSSSPP